MLLFEAGIQNVVSFVIVVKIAVRQNLSDAAIMFHIMGKLFPQLRNLFGLSFLL